MKKGKTLIINKLSEYYAGGNDAAFAKKLGITPQTLSNWKSRNTIDYEIIYTKCVEVEPEWLLTGKGEMIKKDILDNSSLNQNSKLVLAPKGKLTKRVANKDLIKFYDVDFAAGDLEFYDDTHTIKPAYEMDIPEFAGCTAFRTYSNSMEKLIHSGNILFGTNEMGWRDGLEYGQVYGIVCNDRRKFLKYVRKSPTKEETHFLLRSENDSQYDDFDFPKDKIKSIWLIHGWLNNRV